MKSDDKFFIMVLALGFFGLILYLHSRKDSSTMLVPVHPPQLPPVVPTGGLGSLPTGNKAEIADMVKQAVDNALAEKNVFSETRKWDI